jgi:hypothetical protein
VGSGGTRTVERLVPVSATDLEFDPRSVSRTPLCLDAIQHVLDMVEEVSHASQAIGPGGVHADRDNSTRSYRPRCPWDGTHAQQQHLRETLAMISRQWLATVSPREVTHDE